MHAVGDIVWARDVCGDYYKARVVAGRGDGEARELCVHFFGWAAKFDEWVAADSDGLQPWPGNGQPLSEPAEYEWACSKGRLDDEDAQYEVDSLLRKRSRGDGDAADEYLVRFVGYTARSTISGCRPARSTRRWWRRLSRLRPSRAAASRWARTC